MTPEELQAQLKALREADQQWRVPEGLEQSLRDAAAREIGRPAGIRRDALRRRFALAAGVAIAAGSAVMVYVSRNTERPSPASTSTHRTTAAIQPGVFASTEVLVHSMADQAPIGRLRVRLPRSALAAFGVATVDPLATGFIEADVEIGPDGNAQRLRFAAEPVVTRRH